MKIKEYFKKYPKDYIYDQYIRIILNFKSYYRITKNKMIDSIIEQYNRDGYLYNFCTNKELDLLSLLCEDNKDKIDYKKSKWEIDTLCLKGIIGKTSILKDDYKLEIYDEVKDSVNKTVKLYKERKNKRVNDDIWALSCGMLKTVRKLPCEVFENALKTITGIADNDFDKLLFSPLFNYYVLCYNEENKDYESYTDFFAFRDYYADMDEMDEVSNEHLITGSIEYNPDTFMNVFYYDFAINIPEVKKMYDLIQEKYKLVEFLIVIANVKGNYDISKYYNTLINDKTFTKEDIKVIEEGLFNSPSPVFNGRSPKQVELDEQDKEVIDAEFKSVKQDYARLNSSARNDFFRLINSLEKFVNDKYKINDDINNVYDHEAYNKALWDVMDYIWSNLNVFDEYIIVNPDNMSKKELDEIYDLKTKHLREELFIIVGFEKDYTLLLNKDRLYKVKGLSQNIDKIVLGDSLPIFIKTTLIMFRGTLTYDGTMVELGNGIMFDNSMLKNIVNDMNNAKICFDLDD